MAATRTFEYEERTVEPPYEGNDDCNAYYSSSKNSITVNYRPNDPEFNKQSHDVYTACHEMKHHDNYQAGMYAYALNPEQAYKVGMHDEISANIAQLIALRDEYLKTGDIKVLDNEPRFKFYKEAILRGEINPRSTKKEDFDKEMSLIANGTRDMWVKKYGGSETYTKTCAINAAYFCEKNNKHSRYYDKNYERAKKIAYGNIGGVDFTKYMDKDVKIPPKGRELLDNKLNKLTKDGRKAFYESHADIINAEYFEREDDNLMVKASRQAEVLKNDRINPVNRKPPKYPPNAKIKRKQIPDMRSSIIKQPIEYLFQQNQSITQQILDALNSGQIKPNMDPEMRIDLTRAYIEAINNMKNKRPKKNGQNGHSHRSAEINSPSISKKVITDKIIRNRKGNGGNSN